MPSLYEQYMTSVAARDKRLEEERQLALERQLLALRERTLAEQIRAAQVSEGQTAEEIDIMRETAGITREEFEFLKEKEEYERSLAKDITFRTADGQDVTFRYTPKESLSFIPAQESAASRAQAALAERQIEELDKANMVDEEVRRARAYYTTINASDPEGIEFFNTLSVQAQDRIRPELEAFFATQAGAGAAPIGPLNNRGTGTARVLFGANDFARTIFDYDPEMYRSRIQQGATRSIADPPGRAQQPQENKSWWSGWWNSDDDSDN